MSIDWEESELPFLLVQLPSTGVACNPGERLGTAEFRRRSSLLMSNRARLLRFQALPRLTRKQELEALEHYRTTRGVVRCSPAFAAPTQAAIGDRPPKRASPGTDLEVKTSNLSNPEES